jgi:hypothetical protein
MKLNLVQLVSITCYILIQILQSKGQFLTRGAGGDIPRGMDRCYRIYIYILLVSRRLGLNRIIRVTHGICKHSRYSEVLLAGARGFYTSLC